MTLKHASKVFLWGSFWQKNWAGDQIAPYTQNKHTFTQPAWRIHTHHGHHMTTSKAHPTTERPTVRGCARNSYLKGIRINLANIEEASIISHTFKSLISIVRRFTGSQHLESKSTSFLTCFFLPSLMMLQCLLAYFLIISSRDLKVLFTFLSFRCGDTVAMTQKLVCKIIPVWHYQISFFSPILCLPPTFFSSAWLSDFWVAPYRLGHTEVRLNMNKLFWSHSVSWKKESKHPLLWAP